MKKLNFMFGKDVLYKICLIIILLNLCDNCGAQGFAVNNSSLIADSSAMLDVSGVSYGVLINRMTTNERNAINNPAQSLLIYNITAKCFEFYEDNAWQPLGCVSGGSSPCTLPVAPSAGIHNATLDQIIWNWNAVTGSTGYKYNTVNDYLSAVDNGLNTSYNQTGLVCGTPYVLYVWTYNACGNSPVTILNQSTNTCNINNCSVSSVTFTYNGASVTYGTVSGQNGTCWLDRNLGASAVATSKDDINGFGDLFQWGRGADGHQLRTSGTTTTQSSTDSPGHSKFIVLTYYNGDWRNPQNNNLWQGAGGINNPCPSGWRLPIETELDQERASWGAQPDNYGAIASPLKLPAAGFRMDVSGVVYNEGINGNYWTSTVNGVGTGTRYLGFGTNGCAVGNSTRAHGFSIRCIMD